MNVEEDIRKLAEGCLGNESLFVVKVSAPARKGTGKVVVTIDGDHGVNIDDCAEISRRLSQKLDESDLLDGKYLLEVSTPGVDQPLRLFRQYGKHIGRTLLVVTDEKQLEGKLLSVKEAAIEIQTEAKKGKPSEVEVIQIEKIEKATVKVSFK